MVSAVDLIYESSTDEAHTWLRAMIKLALAVIAFFIGREIEVRMNVLRCEELEALRESVVERSKSHSAATTSEEINGIALTSSFPLDEVKNPLST